MPSFVFWNVRGQSRLGLLRRLAREYAADFLLFAECGDDPAAVLSTLADARERPYHYVSKADDPVQVFTIYSRDQVRRQRTLISERTNVHRVTIPGVEPFLLATVHLRSKSDGEGSSAQMLRARYAHEQIDLLEKRLRNDRTLVVGDFNMAPFEDGMTAAPVFHALMDRALLRTEERAVDRKPYKKFYNPMWSLLGDRTPGPPGSFHRLQGMISHGWHMMDQVVLRPSLMDSLDFGSLALVDWDELKTASGRPSKTKGSDHFPLRFVLHL